MSHHINSKKALSNSTQESPINYEFSGFRPPPIPGGLFPPTPPIDPIPFPPLPPHPQGGYSPPGTHNTPEGGPPSYIPSKDESGVESFSNPGPSSKSVSGKSIRICLFKYTYIWENNGRSYWTYLTYVDNRSISGFRWVGRMWFMFGLDVRKIDSFICYRSNEVYYGEHNNRQDNFEDLILNIKKEYTLNGIREIYSKTLTNVEVPEISNDYSVHTIGNIDDLNIQTLIPCTKYRYISYNFSIQVSYPEDISKDLKKQIINYTNNAATEASKVLNRSSSRDDSLTPLEAFDTSFSYVSSALNIFSEHFYKDLNRHNASSLKIDCKIVYEKIPSSWSTKY